MNPREGYTIIMVEGILATLSKAPTFFYQTLTSPYTLWSLLMLGLVLAVEPALCGWRRSSLAGLLAQRPSARIDCICFAIAISGLGTALSFPVIYGVSQLIAVKSTIPFTPATWIGIESRVLDYVFYILLLDFVLYMLHRLLHRVPLLWAFHKVHHSATEFTTISSARQHVVETALVLVCYGILAGLIGSSPQEIALIWGARVAKAYFIHSNVEISFGWIGRWIFVSPNAHRIHHSDAAVHFDSNFGGTFIIWDRIFGTHRTADPSQVRLGLGDCAKHTESFISVFIGPFRDAVDLIRSPWRPLRSDR